MTSVSITCHSGLTGYRPRTIRFGTGAYRLVLPRLVPVLSRISNAVDSGVIPLSEIPRIKDIEARYYKNNRKFFYIS